MCHIIVEEQYKTIWNYNFTDIDSVHRSLNIELLVLYTGNPNCSITVQVPIDILAYNNIRSTAGRTLFSEFSVIIDVFVWYFVGWITAFKLLRHLGALRVSAIAFVCYNNTGDPLHSRAHAHSRAPLFTQPCPHCSHSRAPGEQWARLCVFTLQGCVQASRLCRGSPVNNSRRNFKARDNQCHCRVISFLQNTTNTVVFCTLFKQNRTTLMWNLWTSSGPFY